MVLCLGGVNIRNLSSGKLFSIALDSLGWGYHSSSFKDWLLWIVYVFIFSLLKYGNMGIMSHPIYQKVSGLHAGQIPSQGHFMLGIVLCLPEPWEDHSLISKQERLAVFLGKARGDACPGSFSLSQKWSLQSSFGWSTLSKVPVASVPSKQITVGPSISPDFMVVMVL